MIFLGVRFPLIVATSYAMKNIDNLWLQHPAEFLSRLRLTLILQSTKKLTIEVILPQLYLMFLKALFFHKTFELGSNQIGHSIWRERARMTWLLKICKISFILP